MLRQNGGSNKRGLGLARLSTSSFFTISNSGNWGMGRSTKSSSLSSISSNSDCYDSPIVDPEYIMQLVNDVRKFADVLLYLREAILSEENQDCLHQVVHERLGELLRVLKAVINKHQTLNSVDILSAAGMVIAKVKAVNFKEVNEENKRELFGEIFSSIDTLAFTFGNIVSDFLMGDVDNGSSLGLPVSRRSRSFENLSVESVGSLHERDDIQGTGQLQVEELDSKLLRNDSGIESALSYAKAWSKYTKDVVVWVEKKLSLEVECAKNVAKMAETAKTVVGSQVYMPFQSIFTNAFQNDIENCQLWQQTATALQSNKFVQPLLGRKNELDKQRREIKELWQREQKKMQELETTLRKAKLLYMQRQDEYEKAKSSTVRAEEEHLSYSGGLMKDISKQLEKKRRLEEEALQKAEEANEHYKASMAEVEEKRNDLESIKSDILTQLRGLIYQCDLTLKAATVNLFQLQHAQVVSLPVNCQSLCESAKMYDPGQQYLEFVKNLPKEDIPIESGSFETQSSQVDGVFSKQATNSAHASHGNLSQCSGDYPTQSLEDVGSPTYCRSHKIGEKRSASSTDIQAIRGPPPFRSWSVGNQGGGMCSDSESAGGSSESRSMDSPSASPGDFKRRLPRTPSTGTMSSADDLDEREPPSPSECGLNDLTSETANSPGPFRNTLMSKAAQTHKLRKLRAPSKCRECDSLVVFHGAECEECSLACHKKCLETLAIQCGHKKLHGRLHLFGVEFAQAAKNVPDGIPFIIKKCTSEIESRALNVKGIYRVNGAKSRVEKLCQAFENGKDLVELSELYAHDISNVLKLYLRQLPEPLILFRLYNEFIGLAKESQNVNEEVDTKQASPTSKKRQSVCIEMNRIIIKMKDLLKQLPVPNYNTLQYLTAHLHRVTEQSDENKMSASNLGIIFGPTLIRPRQTDATISLSSLVDYPYQARVVELLITYYEKIFDVLLQPLSTVSQPEESAASVENALPMEERELQQQSKSFIAVKEGILLAPSESKSSETLALLLEQDSSKNIRERSDASRTERMHLPLTGAKHEGFGNWSAPLESPTAAILDIHIGAPKESGNAVTPVSERDSEQSLSLAENGCKVSLLPVKPNRQITKVQLRSPRIKPVIRPVSLPVERILPPCVLNERNSRNVGVSSPEKLGRSPTIEEVSESKALPAISACCRLSCYDTQTLRKTWDKQYKQYDITARTAMIMTNVPQEHRAPESGSAGTCFSTCSTGNNSTSAVPPSKPYNVPIRSVRVTTEGNAPDANPLAAFRAPRTLQPPPGTFYKPPSNYKAKQNEEGSATRVCATSVSSLPAQENTVKQIKNPAIASGATGQNTDQQKNSSEDIQQPDLKPPYQRLRPKRIQELEHREAHFV
ncbi:PREDICTED: rho GTPase-activating protein 29 isoform X1 [Gavialis gangeticus]|uniref:rho GTPase-activating protein 29 isoform X1 n=1 Tax=Gavialis gangeticus TaxID=94835 RepID=UPI00092F6C71|nr:PREDICTED: rho GTPase-activating protein 29 isoform X1 [Gavialis gangeticus]XP_019357184.1 PREDICTED: rho GTPase-activating protein 29 isoform X1 [Gavialis gangeticus]